jgi:hypothetical protein
MAKAGLPSSIIVSKIRTSKTNFDTSTDELIRLQQVRVPPEIINAMVEASSTMSTATSRTGAGDVSKTDSSDRAATHEAGTYLYQERDGSPNDFVLVNLDINGNNREVTVSQANVFGAQSGTMDKAVGSSPTKRSHPVFIR